MKMTKIKLALILSLAIVGNAQAADYDTYPILETGIYEAGAIPGCRISASQSADKSELTVSIGGGRCTELGFARIPATGAGSYIMTNLSGFDRFHIESSKAILAANDQDGGASLFVKVESCQK